MNTMKKVIKIEEIQKSYNGRTGCMCGCLGKYSTTQAALDKSIAENPEYAHYNADDVNERSVKIAISKINKAIQADDSDLEFYSSSDCDIYALDNGNRITALYINK